MVIDARTEEQRTIARARNGDAAAWQALVETELEPAFRLAYLTLGDAAEAQDAVQEALIRAWRGLRRFDPARPFRPWWLRIVLNSARNRRRSLGRYMSALQRVEVPQAATSPEDRAAQGQLTEAFRLALKSLNRNHREVILLRYYLDVSVVDCAEILVVPPGTVKSRLNRGLAALEKRLKEHFPHVTKEWADEQT
ncbi:MAG: sigma-70 family RNA polymerase sigma factor [Chloroflexi bacterium]|nr:sigma-70 family RNA polymerase sigma factor [Chloroflexota bacterium]